MRLWRDDVVLAFRLCTRCCLSVLCAAPIARAHINRIARRHTAQEAPMDLTARSLGRPPTCSPPRALWRAHAGCCGVA